MTSKTSHRRLSDAAVPIQVAFLAFLAFLADPVRAQAQTPAPVPEWLVPVVRVVSDTHVVPSTGVALGAGRVLVPGEFVTGDAPLFVLDGGGDLRRHGRPATLLRRLPLAGLAVLDVPGLERPSPRLSADALDPGQVLSLLAYPPADRIAAGQSFVRRLTSLRMDGTGAPTIDPDRPLPNLTGVLVDACGHWAGFSAARGTASMGTSANTLYRWQPELGDDLQRAGVPLEAEACARALRFPDTGELPPAPTPTPPSEPEPAPDPDPDSENGIGPEAESEPLPEAEPDPEPGSEEKPGQDAVTADQEPPAATETASRSPTPWPRVPPWLWPVLVLPLVAGMVLEMFRRRGLAGAPPRTDGGRPVLRLVVAGSGEPAGTISGRNGRVDCVLGRFDADVVLTHASISRNHLRLTGTPEQLKARDLGSTNGSFVNDAPCAPGMEVDLAPGDRLRLGAVDFLVEPLEGSAP